MRTLIHYIDDDLGTIHVTDEEMIKQLKSARREAKRQILRTVPNGQFQCVECDKNPEREDDGPSQLETFIETSGFGRF